MQISRIQNMPEFLRQGLRYWLLGRPSGHSFELYRVSGSLFHGIVLFCLFHCELFCPHLLDHLSRRILWIEAFRSRISVFSQEFGMGRSFLVFICSLLSMWFPGCAWCGGQFMASHLLYERKDNMLRNVDLLGCSGCVFGQAMHEREQRQDDRQLLDHLYDRSCMVSDPGREIS